MVVIVTTRFNDSTWEENRTYRERHDIACIYGPSQQMSSKIAPDSLVIVIEMNNSVNKIVGISLIRNTIAYDKYYGIYNYGHYNTYIYNYVFVPLYLMYNTCMLHAIYMSFTCRLHVLS